MNIVSAIAILSVSISAGSFEESVAACREIASATQRVSCYDAVVDSRPGNKSKAVEKEVVAVTVKTRTLPTSQSLFGQADADAKRQVEEAVNIEQISQIKAAVTRIDKAANNQLLLTLDNGQRWRQMDNQRTRLSVGDTVVIRKASLGSYRLEKEAGNRKLRVRRVD